MGNITIKCKGIDSVSIIEIDSEQLDYDFLEQIPADKIALYADIKEILGEIDYDTIVDYLEERYDIEPIRIKR